MDSDKLTISVMATKSVIKHCLGSHVGKGSRLHDLDDTGGNSDRVKLQDAVEAGTCEG